MSHSIIALPVYRLPLTFDRQSQQVERSSSINSWRRKLSAAAAIWEMVKNLSVERESGVLMLVKIGKHKGKSVGKLVLSEPDYISWLLAQKPSNRDMIALQEEVKRLIKIFDSKSFSEKCCQPNCGAVATQAVVYGSNISQTWWCNSCNPYSQGAVRGKLQTVRTYIDALTHVNGYCGGRKADSKQLIRDMAIAKELSSRARAKHIDDFFAD